MKVVLDTNIFVAAAFKKTSASARLISAVRSGRLLLIWDSPTLRETQKIINQIPPLNWADVSDLFKPENEFLGPTRPQKLTFVPDPDDRKFLALAQAADATLVTNDDHLLSQVASASVPITTPAHLTLKSTHG